ncbi:MAG TPA: ABC transporter permease [Actinomycetes bacterium]|nr:ABC transporter permease [Actinomycetes bacterium]
MTSTVNAPSTSPTEAEPALGKPRSLGSEAWLVLRGRAMFWIALVLIAVIVLMAAFPGLFTSVDPYAGDLSRSRQAPSLDSQASWFGYDSVGQSVYARVVYGARASILVGIITTVVVTLVGGFLGTVAAFYGRRTDTLISRVGDIFFGIPLLLGALVVLVSFPSDENTPSWATISKVVFALAVLGWPGIMRIMRSSVLQVKSGDYVMAARALGASGSRIIRKHVVPNAVAPVIVYATISLGVYITIEATLSFLGIGLQPPVVSWGVMISDAQNYLRVAPHMLLFPSAFLSVTVLAFIMLGDVVRDALDPKLH